MDWRIVTQQNSLRWHVLCSVLETTGKRCYRKTVKVRVSPGSEVAGTDFQDRGDILLSAAFVYSGPLMGCESSTE